MESGEWRVKASSALYLTLNSQLPALNSAARRAAAFGVCKQRVSGSFSLPSRGSFHLSFTVLYTIGRQVVFRLGGWSPRLPAGFLVSRGTLDTASPPLFSSTGLSPSLACFPKTLRLTPAVHVAVLNPRPHAAWFGLFPFRSPLLWKSRLISFPVATKMFQFATFPFCTLWIYIQMTGLFPAGLPHSDIHGSLTVCVSPWLFAACHVLLRLLAPRHSPFALCCLTFDYTTSFFF